MRFLTKLFAFACALIAVILVFDLGNRGETRHEMKRHYVRAASAPLPPDPVSAAEPPEPVVAVAAPADVRIVTTNGAAFLALRGEAMVAGLSDSIRRAVAAELKRELPARRSGFEGRIESVVRLGIGKLLDKEIAVPVSDIREIEYRDNRIVIAYKDGKTKRILHFDTIKNQEQSLLEQFREEDARRLVEAVRTKIITP